MERGVPIISSNTEDSATEANVILGQQDLSSSYEDSTEEQSEEVSQSPDLSSDGAVPPRHPKLKRENTRGEAHLSTAVRGRPRNHLTDEEIRKVAQDWAANFQGGEGTPTTWTREDARIYPRRDRSKKRKATEFAARNCQSKRLKGLYNDKYRQLLNDDIRDVICRTRSEECGTLLGSQIGMTIWTSAEKECLFASLERLGKDDVCGIASRIGSKSELEVREYLHLLHQGLVAKIKHESRRQLMGFMDMPAAVQISQDCCDLLDKAADALAFRQERYEEQEEQKKWGDSWLLNSDVNHCIEEHLAEDGGSPNIKAVLRPAELLNLGNWLELSSRVFMNPGAPLEDENWQSVAGRDEEPAIRATAFADFQNLATIITKRLVSATLFYTMSRLRAMDPRSFQRYNIVKRADVEAAAKTIGLDINSKRFWTGCPRRRHLAVYRTLSSSLEGQPPMDYNEVEEMLSKEKIPYDSLDRLDDDKTHVPSESSRSPSGDLNSSPSLPVSETSSRKKSPEKPLRDLASEYMQVAMTEREEPIETSNKKSKHPNSFQARVLQAAESKEAYDRVQDEYAEAIDLKASLLEEQKLWDILGQDPPFTIKPEVVEVPDYPNQERKDEEDVRDWRDQMQFWSQWETFERPIPTAAFLRSSKCQSGREESASDLGLDGEDSSSLAVDDETDEPVSESENSEIEDDNMEDGDEASSRDDSSRDDSSRDEKAFEIVEIESHIT